MREIIKLWREPDWAGGRYHYEFKKDGNGFGGSGLTPKMLMEFLSYHFEDEKFLVVSKEKKPC